MAKKNVQTPRILKKVPRKKETALLQKTIQMPYKVSQKFPLWKSTENPNPFYRRVAP